MPSQIDRKVMIVPTAPNILNLVNENIVDNLRRRQNSDLELPSLYHLAYVIHYNTGDMVVTRGASEEE